MRPMVIVAYDGNNEKNASSNQILSFLRRQNADILKMDSPDVKFVLAKGFADLIIFVMDEPHAFFEDAFKQSAQEGLPVMICRSSLVLLKKTTDIDFLGDYSGGSNVYNTFLGKFHRDFPIFLKEIGHREEIRISSNPLLKRKKLFGQSDLFASYPEH